jgi:hypothetical protein
MTDLIDLKWGERNGRWAARGLMNGFDVIATFGPDPAEPSGECVIVLVRAFREGAELGRAMLGGAVVQDGRIDTSPHVAETIDALARLASMNALQKLATLVQSAKTMGIE